MQISQGGATRVLDWRQTGGLEVMLDLLGGRSGELPPPELARSVLEMRASIGVDAARRCAVRGPSAARARVGAIAGEAADAVGVDGAAVDERYEALWRAIVAGSGNVAYQLALNSLIGALAAYEGIAEAVRPGERGGHPAAGRGDRRRRRRRRGRRRRGAARARHARAGELTAARPTGTTSCAMDKLIIGAIPFFLLSVALEALALRHAAHEDERPRPPRGLRGARHADEPGDGRRASVHRRRLEARVDRDPRRHLRRQPAAPPHRRAGGRGWSCSSSTTSPTTPTTAAITASGCSGPRHVVHHSSEHYNLSTALRQDWSPFSATLVLAAARRCWFPPWMVFLAIALEPALPVHAAHRGDRPLPAADRVDLQHAQPPPRAPRLAAAVPRPQLRGHPDHLGPAVRHLRARGRARPLRPDDEHRDATTPSASPSASSPRCGATSAARGAGATDSATRCAGRAGRPAAGSGRGE